uniref:Uncharacterized protein MANES_15G045200 n=1 Tax=Rhizophora mucronata TaxID=61149 RepID=A0A2P2NH93_RHIMU
MVLGSYLMVWITLLMWRISPIYQKIIFHQIWNWLQLL